MREKIASGEYPVKTKANHLCINIPIFELEKLYDKIQQLERALKKRKKR